MKQETLDLLRQHIISQYASIRIASLRTAAITHTLQVEALCRLLANARGENERAAMCAALLHDYGRYAMNAGHASHAALSASFAKRWLEEYGDCSSQEAEAIVRAIANHSHKEKEDSALCEILKDADCACRVLYESDLQNLIRYPQRMERVSQDLHLTIPVQNSGNKSQPCL